MEFCIADTFTGSLARLTGEERKAAKTTAFDLQIREIGIDVPMVRAAAIGAQA